MDFKLFNRRYYLALAMSPPGHTEAAGSKNVCGCYTFRSYGSRRMEKCTNLYYYMGQKDVQQQET
jgi:hypothetical protein